jgi:hypothetical protein
MTRSQRSLLLIFAFVFCSSPAFAQELSPERKVYNLKRLYEQLNQLSYEPAYILETLIPETEAKRAEIAPHYPETTSPDADHATIDPGLVDWVNQYPEEYSAFYQYLRIYISEHK